MSLHSLDNECIGRGPRGARETFWQAHCACGWHGPEYASADHSEAFGRSRRDYEVHVEEALGAEAYYTAPVGCANCAYEGDASVLVGTDVWGATCPNCGSRGRLRPNNEFVERDRSWFR